jgi:hypothetical protein
VIPKCSNYSEQQAPVREPSPNQGLSVVLISLRGNTKDYRHHSSSHDHGDISIEDAILFILARVYPLHVHMDCTESAHGKSPAFQAMK